MTPLPQYDEGRDTRDAEELWERDVMPRAISDAVARIANELIPDIGNFDVERMRISTRVELHAQWEMNKCDLLRLGADLGCWATFEQWERDRADR